MRIISPARRPVPSKSFELIGEALAKRRPVSMRHLTRGRAQGGEREISPQRLAHFRSAWYVDAWCHRQDGLRCFVLDAVEEASLVERRAKDVSLVLVGAEVDGGYGIDAGNKRRWATLVFQPQAAQWVSREQWHPEQAGRWLDDGRYELRVPFADITEIAMDAMRHSDQVQVTAPTDLVAYVARAHARTTALHAAGLTPPPKQHPRA